MVNVPQTYVTGVLASDTSTFNVPFDYEAVTDVFVEIDGESADFSFSGPTTIVLNEPASAGSRFYIYRLTSSNEVPHVFQGGVPFVLRFLDENWQQLLASVQDAHSRVRFERVRWREVTAGLRADLTTETQRREAKDTDLQSQVDVFNDALASELLQFPVDLGFITAGVSPGNNFDLGGLS